MKKNYLVLFKDQLEDSRTKTVGLNDERQLIEEFLKLEKRLLKLDNNLKYHKVLYSNMATLMSDPCSIMALRKCPKLFEMIITSGLDMMSFGNEQVAYLGAFVELKINALWKDSSFYLLVSHLLRQIKKKLFVFCEKTKSQIKSKLQRHDTSSFLYFCDHLAA